jgi:methionyl-tRNA formyltransferase
MRIVFFSPDEPFYLPDFYKYVFDHIGIAHDIKAIIVPPVYKNTTRISLILRYFRVFGMAETAYLSFNVIRYKLMNFFSNSNGNRFHSLKSVFKKYGIPYLFEADVNSAINIKRLREWNIDLIISISCPQIFKKELIDLPNRGCLNLHGSALPDYRGVMPSFWMLANGEKNAGITFFFVNEKIDAGDVLIQKMFPIEMNDTLDSFIKKSKRIGAEIVIEGIDKIIKNEVQTYPLDKTKGRYFGWPTRADVKKFIQKGGRFR